jgi:hypothetical protein
MMGPARVITAPFLRLHGMEYGEKWIGNERNCFISQAIDYQAFTL